MWKEYNKDADLAEIVVAEEKKKKTEREELESVEHLTIPLSEVYKVMEAYARTVTGNNKITLAEDGTVNFVTNSNGRPDGIHVTWHNKY